MSDFDDGYRQGIYDLRERVWMCKTCSKAHDLRKETSRGVELWTWADPIDGHTYNRMLLDEIGEWLGQDFHTILADVKRAAEVRS
jgi:hypothetical protein